ncbi:MAG: hypothetical protein KDD36_14380 [Flavobacteriales bacterium]|nr:hypothetical protein [Flavobacteriales bacterium]
MKEKSGYSATTFLIRAALLFLAWIFIYELWLHPKGRLDAWVIKISMDEAVFWLRLFRDDIFRQQEVIGIWGTHGLKIGPPCNALSLITLFSGFIIAAPGRPITKMIYITSGTILIFHLNVLRLVGLMVIQKNARDWLSFNHDYTFTLIMYVLIFLGWMGWMMKFGNKVTAKSGES